MFFNQEMNNETGVCFLRKKEVVSLFNTKYKAKLW